MNTLDLRQRSIPLKEARYLTVQPLTEEEEHGYAVWSQIVFVVVVCVTVGLVDYMFFAPRVKAQDEYVMGFPVVHQNDYYCQMIKDKGVSVGTSNKQALKELCAKEGVEL